MEEPSVDEEPLFSQTRSQEADGLVQAFGLHPAAGIFTLAVNTMIFAPQALVVGFHWGTLIVSIPCGIFVAFITYMAQWAWFKDGHLSAFIKALMVGFLTALPYGFPGFLTVPSVAVGFYSVVKRRFSN